MSSRLYGNISVSAAAKFFRHSSASCFKLVVVVVVVFPLKTVLTSIQYLLFLPLQGKETNFRGHKLTQNNKVQKNKNKIKDPTLARKI